MWPFSSRTSSSSVVRKVRESIERGDEGKLRTLISEHELDVNERSAFGKFMSLAMIHYACMEGKLSIVKMLCEEFNADPNLTKNDGWTPLMLTAHNNHFRVVQYLVESANADLFAKNDHDQTASEVACADIQKYLQEKEVELRPNDDDGGAEAENDSDSHTMEEETPEETIERLQRELAEAQRTLATTEEEVRNLREQLEENKREKGEINNLVDDSKEDATFEEWFQSEYPSSFGPYLEKLVEHGFDSKDFLFEMSIHDGNNEHQIHIHDILERFVGIKLGEMHADRFIRGLKKPRSIRAWLIRAVGLSEGISQTYADMLDNAGFDNVGVLKERDLTSENLKEFGIDTVGHAFRILWAIHVEKTIENRIEIGDPAKSTIRGQQAALASRIP